MTRTIFAINGRKTLAGVEQLCRAVGQEQGFDIAFHQSNHEGDIVDLVQQAREAACAIVINPAGSASSS